MRKNVDVYRLASGVFVAPMGRGRDGLYRYVDALVKVEPVSPGTLGNCIREGMKCALDGMDPGTVELKKLESFRVTGVRSWSALDRASTLTNVYLEDGRFVVRPHVRTKSGAALADRGEIVVNEGASDAALGEVVLSVLPELG